MGMVEVCPKTSTEKEIAAKRLGCKEDQYDNNQYICLPVKEKTKLVEMCLDEIMGFQELGKYNLNLTIHKIQDNLTCF